MTDRRDFMRAATLALVLRPALVGAIEKAPAKKLSLLIAGADTFEGTHIVDAATRRGHAIRPFRRPRGARMESLRASTAAQGSESAESWDAIIDVTSHSPAEVTAPASSLAGRVRRYLLLSTTQVYANLNKPGIDETAPVASLADPDAPFNDATASAYHALCEKTAEAATPGRACVIRAGLTTGPGDPHDRLAYWAVRVARGGAVLAPGAAGDFVQLIDVRDLAEFVVLCLEREAAGVYNVDSPAGAITMGALLEACRKVSKSDAQFVWADMQFLGKNGIVPYTDMPVWAPATGAYIGLGRISTTKASALGLHCRPLTETVADTLAWIRSQPPERQATLHSGLNSRRESIALKALRAGKT